jgi:hypothetical protein
MSLFNCNAADKPRIRKSAVAGRFYPEAPSELKQELASYLKGGKKLREYPRILISPHAGYVFSGPVAGVGYAAIDPQVKKVICIGPSHYKSFTGLSIPEVDTYETPLGLIPLNKKEIATLRRSDMVHAYPDAHAQEHCLEVQLPFLQVRLKDFSIIPVITGSVRDESEVADLLFPLIDTSTIVVISSDLSHYHPHAEAKRIDAGSIGTILAQDAGGILDACGETPVRIGMRLAEKLKLKPVLLDARNSFETAPRYGSEDRVVGYASIGYFTGADGAKSETGSIPASAQKPSHAPQDALSPGDKTFLLKLAREALNRCVRGEKPPEPDRIPASVQEKCGCFVTLTIRGDLRGCIGTIEGYRPLYQGIIDNARNAALSDPRFPPVTPDELAVITVEVSILTPPVPFTYPNPDALLKAITPGVDGIILSKGMRQATFLPQVWEQLPDKQSFLEHLAMKAGLARDDWKGAEYKKYQAIHFAEE